MKPRNYVTVLTLLADDSITGALDAAEWEVVTKLLLSSDRYHMVGPLDDADPAYSLRTRLFTTKQAFQRWDVRRISQVLQKLLALGVFERHLANGRLFLKVAKRYIYEKGGDTMGVEKPEQTTMDTPGELFALPDEPPSLGTGSHSNANRIKQNKSNDSPRKRERDSGNRDAGAGKESGNRFARDADAFPNDDRWCRFIRCLGLSEVVAFGALWESRWKHDADTLWACASDWIANQQTGNFGAVATAAFSAKWPGFGRAA